MDLATLTTGPAAPLAAPLPEAPWGALIATYLIAVGLPSGLGMLIWWSAGQPAPSSGFERRANLVALSALLVVGGLLVTDLGRPGGFYLMLTRFDLSSPISIGAKLIALKVGLLILAVYADQRSRRPAGAVAPARAVAPAGGGTGGDHPAGGRDPDTGPGVDPGTAGVPTTGHQPGAGLPTVVRALVAAVSFALAIYPATLLSRTWSSPLAGASGAALLFLTTSLVLGAAVAAVIIVTGRPGDRAGGPALVLARRILLTVLVGHAIALASQVLAAAVDPRLADVTAAVATGPYAVTWWLGGVGAGIAVPLAVGGLFPRSRGALVLAAVAAAGGAASVRYLLFAAGG